MTRSIRLTLLLAILTAPSLCAQSDKRPDGWQVRLDKPGPAVAAFGAVDMGGPSMVGMNIYFYGDQAAATAAREAPRWQAWTRERFPARCFTRYWPSLRIMK